MSEDMNTAHESNDLADADLDEIAGGSIVGRVKDVVRQVTRGSKAGGSRGGAAPGGPSGPGGDGGGRVISA